MKVSRVRVVADAKVAWKNGAWMVGDAWRRGRRAAPSGVVRPIAWSGEVWCSVSVVALLGTRIEIDICLDCCEKISKVTSSISRPGVRVFCQTRKTGSNMINC